jgi:hypothetical protein
MSHLQAKFNEILSIGEDKLNSGDYLVISNHLQEIYKSVCKPQCIIPTHIIRKLRNVIPEDEQEDRGISFYLSIEEQVLVMNDRYKRYYTDLITDALREIEIVDKSIETKKEVKQTKLQDLREFRATSPDKKHELRFLNTEYKILVQELRNLKHRKSTLKRLVPQLQRGLAEHE